MVRILKDKYFLLCLAVAFIILSSSLFSDGGGSSDRTVGVVYDIRETENGFVFDLYDSDGKTMKCFSRNGPEEGGVYEVGGTESDDGTMFFTNSMVKLS